MVINTSSNFLNINQQKHNLDKFYPENNTKLLFQCLAYSSIAYQIDYTSNNPSYNFSNITKGTEILYADDSKPKKLGFFIAINKKENFIIISFRGSSNIENWLTNIDESLLNVDNIYKTKNAFIHRGFFENVFNNEVYFKIERELSNIQKQYPNFKIIFTGHSLGGCSSNLAASLFSVRQKIKPEKIICYNFASPRFCNKSLSEKIDKLFLSFRITNLKDKITQVPSIEKFYHTKNEYYYTGNNEIIKTNTLNNESIDGSFGINAFETFNNPVRNFFAKLNRNSRTILFAISNDHLTYLDLPVAGSKNPQWMSDPTWELPNIIFKNNN